MHTDSGAHDLVVALVDLSRAEGLPRSRVARDGRVLVGTAAGSNRPSMTLTVGLRFKSGGPWSNDVALPRASAIAEDPGLLPRGAEEVELGSIVGIRRLTRRD